LFHDRKALGREAPPQPFRFDEYFFQPWRGRGVIRDALGFKKGSYEAYGSGRIVKGRVRLEYARTFDKGMVNESEWEILESRDGHILARETMLGVLGHGCPTARGYRWSYAVPLPTSPDRRPLTTRILYSLTGTGEARSSGAIGPWGLPFTTVSGEFRHDAAASA
jgi:hypothetical protein